MLFVTTMLFCSGLTHSVLNHIDGVMQGRIQDFKLGGGALKEIATRKKQHRNRACNPQV